MADYINTYTIAAALAIAVSIIRYGLYLHSIFKGETKPHVFSWLNWGIIVGIGAFAQLQLDSGLSSLVLFIVSGTCLFIAALAIFIGEKDITRSDWITFVCALVAIPVWQATNNPFLAILTLIAIDILTYFPTIRKSWHKPFEEPPVSYIWAGSRYFFTLFTVQDPTIQNLAYPFFLMAVDWSFVVYLYWRRYVVKRVAAI